MPSFSTNVWTEPDDLVKCEAITILVTFTILFLSTLQRKATLQHYYVLLYKRLVNNRPSVFVILPSVREQLKGAIFTDDESTSAVKRTIFFLALICPNTNASLCRILIKPVI